MKLNSKQTKILIVSIILFIAMGMYPPWKNTYDFRGSHSESPAGYALIILPPKPKSDSDRDGLLIDFERFLVQSFTLLITTIGMLLLTNTSNNKVSNDDISNKEENKPEYTNRTKEAQENTEEPEMPDEIYPFSPEMPDITKRPSDKAFQAGQYMILFTKNPPTISEGTTGEPLPISYPFAMVAINTNKGIPEFMVTLETGFTDSVFLCTFDNKGTHKNYGNGTEYLVDNKFIDKALAILQQELNFNEFHELK